jgi:hypothetical protein
VSLLFQVGLRYNENATDPGAQTERRGAAGPVRDLLGGWNLTGRFVSPFERWLLLLQL